MVETEVALLHNYLLLGGMLFTIGLVGFLARRNMIVMFLAAEMMLQGVSISLVGWGRFHNDWGGQMLVVFIITIAACEAAIALALVLMLYRASGNLDLLMWNKLREENLPPFVDLEVPDEVVAPIEWPLLPTAGVEPTHDEEEQVHRSHV